MFSSVLIANRGEIACRIARTARRMGLRVIAVHSAADRQSLHLRMADEAHEIGPAPVAESYLRGDRIIAAALKFGAQCIHPGYGFLSENAGFAEACAKAGIAFVGPSPAAMRAMGLKDAAKDLMAAAAVPVVPGYRGQNQDAGFLAERAEETGYPVMIKAVAGGGGKGMRRVEGAAGFPDALAACQREAMAAFGDGRVLIEKFIGSPRHVEIQILADTHGNCVHLFERDCSLQRRHQKVIEEAPAPGLVPELRAAMGAAAVAGAKAVGYSNAGTVEFILGPGGDFYFMEMNTRLQVEHPVTEMITGLDLVEQQFRIAAGEKLPVAQADITATGHAIEARLYAESPETGFLPQTGKLHRLHWPELPHVRIDTGVEQGSVISPHYDPMIAKVIAWGETRAEACERLGDAIDATQVLGLRTNQRFLRGILRHADFVEAKLSTAFIDDRLDELIRPPELGEAFARAAGCWMAHASMAQAPGDVWSYRSGWSLAGLPRKDRLDLELNGEDAVVEIDHGSGTVRIARAGEVFQKDWEPNKFRHPGESRDPTQNREHSSSDLHVANWVPAFAGMTAVDSPRGAFDPDAQTLFVSFDGYQIAVRRRQWPMAAAEAGAAVMRAPMPGKVLRLLVKVGDSVKRGEPLLILEAMKMEHTLKAGIDGTVASLAAAEGTQVKEGDVLCGLTPSAGT